MYQTIGFIGTGTMGGVLARAAAQGSPASQLFFANRTPSKAQELAAELHGQAASNEEIAKACTLIFLGVKPQMMAGVLAELGPALAGREDRFRNRCPPRKGYEQLLRLQTGQRNGRIPQLH